VGAYLKRWEKLKADFEKEGGKSVVIASSKSV
jgi:hypothetical protein